MSTQCELSKLFKPVTVIQTDLKEGLVSELKPIGEGMKHLPKAITLPQFASITAYDNDGEEEEDAARGDIVEKYLQKFASTFCADKTFRLRDKDCKFYIENKEGKKGKQYNCW